MAFVVIKMGRRQGARSGAYLNRYVTDEQRGRRPIFIATLRAAVGWLFFRVARSLRINQDMLVARALKNSQLTSGESLWMAQYMTQIADCSISSENAPVT